MDSALPEPPWTLETEGFFHEDDIDAEPQELDEARAAIESRGWVEALDAEGIQDVIYNAADQLEAPSDDDLFRAFLCYVENDAFIEFS
jgi:hypothetical protein